MNARRRFIVTGANGHLGNVLVRELIARGEEVVALALPGDPSPALNGVAVPKRAVDIRDAAGVERVIAAEVRAAAPGGVVVIHTAGIVSIASTHSEELAAVNVGGTTNVANACLNQGVDRLIYVSSVHAIPELPHGETIAEVGDFAPERVVGGYACTKAAATALVLDAARRGLDAVVVHPSGIAGPGDFGRTHFTQLVVDYLGGKLRAYVAGGYDFVDVRDVAAGILAAAERGKRGECYILSNRYVTVRGLLQTMDRVTGVHRATVALPMTLAKLTAPLSELHYRLLRQPPLYTSYSLYTVGSNACFSHEKATRALGYCPRPLEATIADTVDWLRRQGRVCGVRGKGAALQT
jgi:dihydroflavonol-4-reductase